MVVMGMGGIYRGLIFDATSILQATNADIWVVQKNTFGPFADDSRIPEDLQYNIRTVPGVMQAGPISFRNMQIDYHERKLRFHMVGYRWDSIGGPSRPIAGKPISRKHYELVADKNLGLKIGAVLHLGLHDYSIVGLTENMVSPTGDPVVYASLPDLQELLFQKNNEAIRNDRSRVARRINALLDNHPDLSSDTQATVDDIVGNTHIVNAIIVRVNQGENAENIAHKISRWNHYTAMTHTDQEEILTKYVIEKARRQLGLFRIILLVISAVVIALIIYTLTIDKLRELATLKLIGAQNYRIIGLIMQQSLAMGILGYCIGAILIYFTYDKFPRRVIIMQQDMGLLFFILIVICILASLQGVRTALRVDPAVVLGT
jgi:putative ABC transport system permease protein